MPPYSTELITLVSARQSSINESDTVEQNEEAATVASQRGIFAVSVIFTILPSVAVGLRLVSGRLIRRSFSWADYTVFAAAVCIPSRLNS